MDAAIDGGINCMDCADIYSGGRSEEIVGNALKSSFRRERILVISKVFWRTGDNPNDEDNTRHHIIIGYHNSLKRLKTDHMDVYFLHRTDLMFYRKSHLKHLIF